MSPLRLGPVCSRETSALRARPLPSFNPNLELSKRTDGQARRVAIEIRKLSLLVSETRRRRLPEGPTQPSQDWVPGLRLWTPATVGGPADGEEMTDGSPEWQQVAWALRVRPLFRGRKQRRSVGQEHAGRVPFHSRSHWTTHH